MDQRNGSSKTDEIQLREEQNGILKNQKHIPQIKNRNEHLCTVMGGIKKKKKTQATNKTIDYLLAIRAIFLSTCQWLTILANTGITRRV